MNQKFSCIKVAVLLTIGTALAGCGPDAPVSEKKVDTPPLAVKAFKTALPDNVKSLIIKDGGACYLDTLNDTPVSDKPATYKSGAVAGFVGWAVADMKSDMPGSAVLVEVVQGVQSYYAEAAFYNRPGLGKAIGNEKLDGGGVLLNGIALPAETGFYKINFLIQSGNDLVRCNTGHKLIID